MKKTELIRILVVGLGALSLVLFGYEIFLRDKIPPPLISFDELMKGRHRVPLYVDTNKGRENFSITQIEIPYPQSVVDDAVIYLKDLYENSFNIDLIWVKPKAIVLHSIALGTLRNSLEKSGFLRKRFPWKATDSRYFSLGSHFIVDRDGSIYCLTPPLGQNMQAEYSSNGRFRIRRHVKEANPYSLAIENIAPTFSGSMKTASDEVKAKAFTNLTEAQVGANVLLVMWLKSQFDGITHVFGHHQFSDEKFRISLFESGLIDKLVRSSYFTANRVDPGDNFLSAVVDGVNSSGFDIQQTP